MLTGRSFVNVVCAAIALQVCLSVFGKALSAQDRTSVQVISGIEFAQVAGHRLLLDLYLPTESINRPLPVVVWVHGGAWRAGDRTRVPVRSLTEHGFAVASVDYRLSPVARFPAQVHDIKAAIRFLRANAGKHGLDTKSLAIAGASAGGHLAALTGVSGRDLEGQVGRHLEQSSSVSAIVSFYGASNLQTILSQSTPHGLSVRVPALQLLLGGQPINRPELARQASPVAHLDKNDPPLLLIHGDQDPQMPINQAHELHGGYLRLKRPVEFDVIYGAAHGGEAFYAPKVLERVADFLHVHLAAESQ
ncbi:MAG: alpha/beta hydrolase fold domain-containing protein [Planctomycetota bacterium]